MQQTGEEPLLSRRLTLLLHRLVSTLIDGSTPEFRKMGLSIHAARTLVSLLEAGGEAQVGAISHATSIDLSTTSHILRRLEAQHLLKRERLTSDNRVVVVRLLPRGEELAAACRKASLDHEAILTSGMSPADVERFKCLLEDAFANAQRGFG